MKALFSELGGKKVAAVAVVVIAAGGGAFMMKGKKAAKAEHGHEAEAHGEEAIAHHSPGLFGRFSDAFDSIQVKVDQIRRLDLENAKLKLENAQLRVKLEGSQFECGVAQSKQLTEKYSSDLAAQTGSKVGRTLASIGYRAPTHLLPKQLHALGVGYLKAREYEKSAVIFTLLGDIPKDTIYKAPSHQVLTGMTWYRLKNWDMADFYFDRALKSEGDENLQYQAQARLWKALVAKSRGKTQQSQFWMQELVDQHPHSPEANWINPQKEPLERVPASKNHKKTKAHKEEGKSHEQTKSHH